MSIFPSSIEISRLRIENEKQKEKIQVLNREVEKTTLLKLHVEDEDPPKTYVTPDVDHVIAYTWHWTSPRFHEPSGGCARYVK